MKKTAWIKRIESEKLSVSQLRKALKEARTRTQPCEGEVRSKIAKTIDGRIRLSPVTIDVSRLSGDDREALQKHLDAIEAIHAKAKPAKKEVMPAKKRGASKDREG